MALVKLSDTWVVEDYAQVFESIKADEWKESPALASLNHFAFPGLTWRMQPHPRGRSYKLKKFASVLLAVQFGSGKESVKNVWTEWTLTVVAGDSKANLQNSVPLFEYLAGESTDWGLLDAFPDEALAAAVRSDGHLELRLDLTLFKIVDLLKCRETVRALLSDNLHADITVNVEGKTFQAHKAVLARRCPGFTGSVPYGTTANAYSAFLGAVYFDNFDFLSNWELAVGVLRLSRNFGAADFVEFCDHALSELIATLDLRFLLQVLAASVELDAPVTKEACIGAAIKKRDILTSADWTDFKATANKEVFQAICDVLLERFGNSTVPRSMPAAYRAPEVQLSHAWLISAADLVNAIVPQPTHVCSRWLFEHKAFPNLSWYLKFYPRGNTRDPDFKPGFSSLYLKAIFGSDDEAKAVYAKWKATITCKDGKQVSVPDSPEYVVYTGAQKMTFGFANAFRAEQYDEALDANNLNLNINLDLTIANIPEIIKCRDLISSFHSDKTFADVEMNVNGTIFKAHKFILAAKSSVFRRMFETDMEETKTGKLEVKDTTAEAFDAFLVGVYYEGWAFLADMDATIDVLELAERYAVFDLKRYCDEALAHFADETNVLKILPLAAIHGAEATKAACIEILFANQEMMKSDGWIKFKKSVSKEIAFDIMEAMSQRGYRLSLKRKREDDD